MPITFRCACGKKLKAPDSAAGKRVGCTRCDAVHTVPASTSSSSIRSADSRNAVEEQKVIAPPSLPRRTRDDDDEDFDEVRERPRPARRRRKKRPVGNSNRRLILLLGGIGALLVVVLGLGACAVYYFGFLGTAGPSAEEQLIGNWETDPEPWHAAVEKAGLGVMFRPNVNLTFNKDHSFKLDFMMDWEGRWQIVSWDGNRMRVKLVTNILGIEQSDPPTTTITVIDKDHIYLDSNEPSLHMQLQFRRIGTGRPANQRADTKPAEKGGANLKQQRSKYVPRISEKKLEEFLKGRGEAELAQITDTEVFAIMGEPTRREPPFTVQKNGEVMIIYKAFWEVPGSGIYSQIGFRNGKILGMILGLETPRGSGENK